MKKINSILIIVITLFLSSCTMVPERFNQAQYLSPNGGYVVESEDTNGFNLEIFFKSYSFVPNPDDNIQEAKSFFIQVANKVASKNGKAINPIIQSQLNVNSSRNILDGNYAIYVSGFVSYKK